jgi:aminoglycoside phosphotransferase (APT) family kinase protein
MPGIDARSVTNWISRHVEEAAPPMRFDVVSGGHSNITYRVTANAARRYALRRPPIGQVPRGAHDVVREYRILAALTQTEVPVATPVAVCEDDGVTGAPFYLAEWVDGFVVDSPAVAVRALTSTDSRQAAANHLVDVLATMHELDVDRAGLATLGKREDYLGRQLARLAAVWDRTKTRELPAIDHLRRRLEATRPPQRYTGIVHSDYRLGNTILSGEGTIRAVLDWELCSLGDVLADVGFLLNNWELPGDNGPRVWMAVPPTRAGGFPSRSQILDRYASTTGVDLSDIGYYRAFAYWRVAVIAEGIKRRYETAAMATHDVDPEFLARRVTDLIELAGLHLGSASSW